ncbi:16S rRNA (guanine(527)-N(7))-methyltransferase RsmG [Yoonia sp. MH D7]
MQNIAGMDVSRETIERLELFEALTKKWNPTINLVARSTLDDLWERHIVDSAQLFQYAPSLLKHWVDVGSGGGFPGIVIAAMAKELSPATRITMIESDQRKSTFLRTASRELSLDVTVLADRIEDVAPQSADVVSARALSNLDDLFALIQKHMTPLACAILPKGRTFESEISQAEKNWRFDLSAHASMTEPDARILVVKDIIRVRS